MHKAGIGLISMKQIAGPNPAPFLAEVPKKAPDLIAKGRGLPFGAALRAIWSDERFTTCAVSMRNTDQLRNNIEAARKYRGAAPSRPRSSRSARRLPRFRARPPSAPDCDGCCSIAAGTKNAASGDITRYLTLLRAALASAARLAAGSPPCPREVPRLGPGGRPQEAARGACPSKLDFAGLLGRVERDLA